MKCALTIINFYHFPKKGVNGVEWYLLGLHGGIREAATRARVAMGTHGVSALPVNVLPVRCSPGGRRSGSESLRFWKWNRLGRDSLYSFRIRNNLSRVYFVIIVKLLLI